MHVRWCESEGWKGTGGRYVKQDLSEWILDKGWRYQILMTIARIWRVAYVSASLSGPGG